MIITSISSIDHYRPRAMLSTHFLLDPSRASLLHLRRSLCARIPTRSLSHNYQFRQCSIQNYAYFNTLYHLEGKVCEYGESVKCDLVLGA